MSAVCGSVMKPLVPAEGDVSPRDLLQVVHRCHLAGEAVVGVVVGHDGGGPQLTELAVRTLQLQLNRLQLCVFTPVHCWDANEGDISFHQDCHNNNKKKLNNKQDLEPACL